MKLHDLEVLKKDADGFYDFFENTFDYTKQNTYQRFTVTKENEMRIDLISNQLYGTTDYIDVILNINNIDNPLNIKEGTVLIYPRDNVTVYRINPPDPADDVISNLDSGILDKSTRIDPNRESYIRNGSSLPPTILDRKTNQIDISGSRIVFGSNLFKK